MACLAWGEREGKKKKKKQKTKKKKKEVKPDLPSRWFGPPLSQV
jgi:hypothetical protein